jgi:hypothetical protein
MRLLLGLVEVYWVFRVGVEGGSIAGKEAETSRG